MGLRDESLAGPPRDKFKERGAAMHLPKPSEVLMFIGSLAESLDQLLGTLFLIGIVVSAVFAFIPHIFSGRGVTDLSSDSSQDENDVEDDEAQNREERRLLLQAAENDLRDREDRARRDYEQRLIDDFGRSN